jgi:protein arginine kinase activator
MCTRCGFTWEEYRSRGLLGCPHCYAGFGDALQADIAWLHQALAFAAPEPGPAEANREILAGWREKLAEALRREEYGEAARLRRLIQNGSAGSAAPAPDGGQGPGLGLA